MSENTLERISISLPGGLLANFDLMVERRGYGNRSKAVVEILNRELVDYGSELGNSVMAGTVTIVYSNGNGSVQSGLSAIERRYIDEVIGSLHVQLENDHTMEVVLVQGAGDKLREIADELTACRGVLTGRLTLSSAILPPIHQN